MGARRWPEWRRDSSGCVAPVNLIRVDVVRIAVEPGGAGWLRLVRSAGGDRGHVERSARFAVITADRPASRDDAVGRRGDFLIARPGEPQPEIAGAGSGRMRRIIAGLLAARIRGRGFVLKV